MLSSQGKWQFMLLVRCLGTALCWNGRLLTFGRNFLTLFSVDSNHYIECSPLHSIHQKGLLFSESKPTNFPSVAQKC
jgi:hypothetical protein